MLGSIYAGFNTSRTSSFGGQSKYYKGSSVGRMEKTARQANLRREKEIRGYFDTMIGLYAPGGGFGRGYEAELERTKTKDVARGTQQLISSGLYGTTTAAGLGKAWEEEVGAPSRLRLEDLRLERYAQALGQKASFVERIENMYPDYGLIAGLQSQIY